MSEVIVCAEPSAKKEAAEFVEQLGAEPELRSLGASLRDLKGKRSLLLYLRGDEPKSVLRHCLSRLSANKSVITVIYSAVADQHKAAEWGQVVGQFRPKGTYICFARDEVRKALRLSGTTQEDLLLRARTTDVQGTPLQIPALRKYLDLTQADVADAVGVTHRTVQNWEARKQVPSRKLRDLHELSKLLPDYMDKSQIAEWMHSPNEAFGGLTPRQLIQEGKTRDIIVEFRRMQVGEPV